MNFNFATYALSSLVIGVPIILAGYGISHLNPNLGEHIMFIGYMIAKFI